MAEVSGEVAVECSEPSVRNPNARKCQQRTIRYLRKTDSNVIKWNQMPAGIFALKILKIWSLRRVSKFRLSTLAEFILSPIVVARFTWRIGRTWERESEGSQTIRMTSAAENEDQRWV
jgi:hypothetical protein